MPVVNIDTGDRSSSHNNIEHICPKWIKEMGYAQSYSLCHSSTEKGKN